MADKSTIRKTVLNQIEEAEAVFSSLGGDSVRVTVEEDNIGRLMGLMRREGWEFDASRIGGDQLVADVPVETVEVEDPDSLKDLFAN